MNVGDVVDVMVVIEGDGCNGCGGSNGCDSSNRGNGSMKKGCVISMTIRSEWD